MVRSALLQTSSDDVRDGMGVHLPSVRHRRAVLQAVRQRGLRLAPRQGLGHRPEVVLAEAGAGARLAVHRARRANGAADRAALPSDVRGARER